jgi:hypothetical protein
MRQLLVIAFALIVLLVGSVARAEAVEPARASARTDVALGKVGVFTGLAATAWGLYLLVQPACDQEADEDCWLGDLGGDLFGTLLLCAGVGATLAGGVTWVSGADRLDALPEPPPVSLRLREGGGLLQVRFDF